MQFCCIVAQERALIVGYSPTEPNAIGRKFTCDRCVSEGASLERGTIGTGKNPVVLQFDASSPSSAAVDLFVSK